MSDARDPMEVYVGVWDVICTQCGKKFGCVPGMHVYKRYSSHPKRRLWFCSYHCVRQFDKGRVDNRGRHKKKEEIESDG